MRRPFGEPKGLRGDELLALYIDGFRGFLSLADAGVS
jgi:hypothetical protein